MTDPKISILLPCLNARQYLEPRLDSLVRQTHRHWEAIVLDSHSTDGSWEFFQSIASADPRFRLCQIPREGLYAAINRGLELASGEFLHIATCDDTMVPEFLNSMLEAFVQCPEAGVAACDVRLIDRNGGELAAEDLIGQMAPRTIKALLDSGSVRTVFPTNEEQQINYRPIPHDCLLHFGGRSVYFSLSQLIVRTEVAKAAAPFETTVGSVADFGWLVRLTSFTGSVHVPKKLAMWRFHGDQLSVQRDDSRLTFMKTMCERALVEICERYQGLLTRNDCAALLLPYKTLLATSAINRIGCWFEAVARLLLMCFQRPSATLEAIRRARFRVGTRRHSLLPMIFQGIGLAPKELNASNIYGKS